MMKKDVTIELVKEFDKDFDGSCKVIHRNALRYQCTVPIQELIDNGDIEEIYFVIDTVVFNQNPGVDMEEVMEEYSIDIWDDYNGIPRDLQFETDNYIIRFDADHDALKNALRVEGYEEYETVIYVKEIKSCRIKVFARSKDEVSKRIYGPTGDNILDIIDNNNLETVFYEHGIDDIISH